MMNPKQLLDDKQVDSKQLDDSSLSPSFALERISLFEIDALTDILGEVCEATAWEYGEVWTVAANQRILELNPTWRIKSQLSNDRRRDWGHFYLCSKEFILHFGEGLPGRTWISQTPQWIANVSAESESYFLRNQIAKAFGVKAGFGIPVETRQLQVVLAFFMSEVRREDHQLMESTQAIVAQLQS
jgi:hypothetical protein